MNRLWEKNNVIIYIVVAYIFSLAVRYIWINWASSNPEFFWNGQLMINTNDGYFFASGAQKALFGMHEYNPRVPSLMDYGVVFFTTLFAKILPFSLETIILYMPGFISGLVVIPLILIGRLYGSTLLGFLAALIGSIAWSYYNRTMFGYYDTDMFSAMAIMFVVYFLILSLEKRELYIAFISSIVVAIYPFLYDQGQSLVYAIGIVYIIYLLLFFRKENFTYRAIILLSISLMFNIPFFLRLIVLVLLYFIFKTERLDKKYEKIGALLFFILFLLVGNVFGLIFSKISGYVIRGVEEGHLHFFAVNQTVREANKIPFEVMANRIIGHPILFVLSILGYLALVFKRKSFIITLPLIGIGIFALWGGLRFTVYAVPVAAFSFVYLFYFVGSFLKDKKYKYALMVFAVVFALYPNIKHIIGYKVPTVFNKSEVRLLDKLKSIGSNKDYVLTWWDYGYPIWYYSNKNTLVDGGKHNHDNFIASEILCTTSQLEAARLSRMAIEKYISSNYKVVADELFKDKDPNKFLESLRKDKAIDLPQKTVDVYLYLPYRMINIFSTIKLFSNIDLLTGKPKSHPFFYKTSSFKDVGDKIILGNNIYIDKKRALIKIGQNVVPIKDFYVLKYVQNNKLVKNKQSLNKNGVSVVFLDSYGVFVVMNDEMLKSTYIQMFIFDNYDKNLFEPVILSPWSKIYKVKI